MRKSFHEQLAEAEGLVAETGGLVLELLERTVRALETRDTELSDVVIAGDDAVDRNYIEVEQRILTLLATQAPVASDLRLVSAMLHINIHLERMADLCVNIAKFVKLSDGLPFSEGILQALTEMGWHASKMIEQSMDAFAKRDLDLALGLPVADQAINRLNRRLIKEVARYATDDEQIEWGSRMVLVSRQLERLGDHAVDIGEQVAFMVTGEFREFTDASGKDLV